jgi:thiamine-monophosphate kinase
MHEFDLIKNYFSKLTKNNKSALNLNDDVFFDKKKELVISVDTYNEGVHFPNFNKPYLVIKKILRATISDLICKGVKPKYYFISGSGNKKTFSIRKLKDLTKSLLEEQKKYNIRLCGGDTTFSKKLSFSITVIGFSKTIIFRNNTKINDDIYVTGNIGDSFVGLNVINKKINLKRNYNNYFLDKYYKPDVQIKLVDQLLKFSNSSIDISDGLFADLEKMINNQNAKYEIHLDKVPISKYMEMLLKKHRFKKIKMISNGDDYQILFTANKNKSRIIKAASKKLNLKITKIGRILPSSHESSIIDQKGRVLRVNKKGYVHRF